MEIRNMRLADIRRYKNNPRDNDRAVAKVAASLKEFGWRQPIVVDKKNIIVIGDTRYLAAQSLGMEKVPVHTAKNLSPEKVRALRIADNRTGDEAKWSDAKLATEISWLHKKGYDLSLTAFDENQWDRLLGLDQEYKSPTGVDPDKAPPAARIPITKIGDVWNLGPHRVTCTDSTQSTGIDALLQGEQADIVITDPPYGVNYEDGAGRKIENDNLPEGEFSEFLSQAFSVARAVVKPGGCFYCFHAATNQEVFLHAIRVAGWHYAQEIIWVKNLPVLGRQDYNWRHEPIAYGWAPGGGHYFCKDYTSQTVVDDAVDIATMSKADLKAALQEYIDQPDTAIHEARPTKNKLHPTMKPTELLCRLIKNSSVTGQVVLDPFAGSGSTLIAAQQTNRVAYLAELDGRYCDVIVKRWQDFTGETAILQGTDQIYERIAKERKAA